MDASKPSAKLRCSKTELEKIRIRQETGELSGEAAEEEDARFSEAMKQAERDAEAEELDECGTALWNYAVSHQLEILKD